MQSTLCFQESGLSNFFCKNNVTALYFINPNKNFASTSLQFTIVFVYIYILSKNRAEESLNFLIKKKIKLSHEAGEEGGKRSDSFIHKWDRFRAGCAQGCRLDLDARERERRARVVAQVCRCR